jgi:hypothetical protein
MDPLSPARNGDAGSQLKARAAELGQRATAAIESKMDTVATGIDSAASSLHSTADRLPGGDRVSDAAHSAADAMEGAADYLREQDLRGVLSDIRRTVTRHPGAALLAAAALGFVVARSITRD